MCNIYPFYKAAVVFEPRQLPILDLTTEKFTAIISVHLPYWRSCKFKEDAIPNPLDLPAFWESMIGRDIANII